MKRLIAILSAAVLCFGAHAQQGYVPSAENLQSRKIVSDARLGIFIHWGIYSMLGDGEWVMNNQKINYQEYARLADGFYPSQFNADEWIAAFKDAGAEYVTFTSRHHDGFSMWDSDASDYNIVDATPFHRDVIKELADACQKQNFRLHLYYSHLDWQRLDYWPRERTGLYNGRPDGKEGDWEHYQQFMKDQLTELLTKYGPIGCIWFDGVWDKDEHNRDNKVETWGLYEQYELIHSLQPACLVANNHHFLPFEGEDLQIFERDIPGRNEFGFSEFSEISDAMPLETCQTMNKTWGYNINDHAYKSSAEIITYLVRAAGKDANLLLNIGPRPDGSLPDEALVRLKEIGCWMRQYGSSIKGTHGGFAQEEPWGVQTRKDKTIYVHILNPTDVIELPYKNVKTVRQFGGGLVMWAPTKEGVIFNTPSRDADTFDQIIEIILK